MNSHVNRFVAPDNGVLTIALRDLPPKRLVELTERRYARPTVSRTFEGRDRFAPAAAWLAKGIQLTALGRPAGNYVQLDLPAPQVSDDVLSGEVVMVDRFGNLVSNIDRRTFEAFARNQPVSIVTDGQPVARLVSTYSEIGPGELCALFGGSDHLELAVNAGHAGRETGGRRGSRIEVRRS